MISIKNLPFSPKLLIKERFDYESTKIVQYARQFLDERDRYVPLTVKAFRLVTFGVLFEQNIGTNQTWRNSFGYTSRIECGRWCRCGECVIT